MCFNCIILYFTLPVALSIGAFYYQQLCANPFTHKDLFHFFFEGYDALARAPLGSAEQRAPLGGHFVPPEISRTTQHSDKRQTASDSPWRELSKACKFCENRGHRAGQT